MSNRVVINNDSNEVSLTNNDRRIIVTNSESLPYRVEITQPITNVVTVNTIGPQGPVGPQGDSVLTRISESLYATTSSLEITGSIYVTDSVEASSFTGSFSGDHTGFFSGSFSGSGADLSDIPPSAIIDKYPLNSIIIYLNTNVTLESTQVVSDNTMYVTGSFTSVPTGFPSLTKNDFIYYINGVSIAPSNVVSITDNSSYCEVIFNTASIGYSLENGDTLTIIGKFNPNAFSSGFSSGFSSYTYDLVPSSSILTFYKTYL